MNKKYYVIEEVGISKFKVRSFKDLVGAYKYWLENHCSGEIVKKIEVKVIEKDE